MPSYPVRDKGTLSLGRAEAMEVGSRMYDAAVLLPKLGGWRRVQRISQATGSERWLGNIALLTDDFC